MKYMKTIQVIFISFIFSILLLSSFNIHSAYADDSSTPVFALQNASTGVEITWDEVTGASRYIIYRKEPGSSYSVLSSSVTSSPYIDTTAVSGQEYYYTIKSVVNNVPSAAASSQLIMFLAQPQNLTYSNTVIDQIDLSWSAVTGATHYRIYRKEKVSGAWGSWERVLPDTATTSYTIDEDYANPATHYRYSVRAVNGSYSSVLAVATVADAATVHNRITFSPAQNSDISNTITTAMSSYSGTASWPVRFMFSEGNYQLNSIVDLNSNTALIFDNSLINFTGKFRLTGDVTNNGYHIKRVTIHGGEFRGSNCLMDFYHGGYITVKDVKIIGTADNAHAIQIAGVNYANIINCKFYGTQTMQTSVSVYAEFIQLDTLAKSIPTPPGVGDDEPNPYVDGKENKHITIENCYFQNHKRAVGSHSYALNKNFSHITINNNTFVDIDRVAIRPYAWNNSSVTNNDILPGEDHFNTYRAIQASAINPTQGANGVFVYEDDDDGFTESSLPHNLTITGNTIIYTKRAIRLDGDCEDLDGYPDDPHTFYYRNVSILDNSIDATSDKGLDLSNQYNVFTNNNIVYNTTGNYAAIPVLLP